MNSIWIASYPKSGNTWVRFLLSHLLRPAMTSSAEIEACVPDIHKNPAQASAEVSGSSLVKTHFLPSHLPTSHTTVGAVYVYRDPLDVLASHVNYFELAPDSPECKAFVRSYLSKSGPSRWAKLGFGGWEEHIVSWALTPKEFPVLAVSYESLKQDTNAALTRIVEFLGLDFPQPEIETACWKSTAKSLQRLEESEVSNGVRGFFSSEQRGKTQDFRFIKEATISRAARTLPPQVLTEARQRYAELTQLLYPDSD